MFENLSYEPFKEPRGFLKLLQWLMAIFAFATTVNFSAEPSVELTCVSNVTNSSTTPPPSPSFKASHPIEYPFDLDHITVKIDLICNNKTYECGPIGNAKSDSQFFVTSGVLAFLYSTVMIGVFLLNDKCYTESPRAPLWDFLITLVFAVFFISGSSAWAHGLSAIRSGSDPNNWHLLFADNTKTLCTSGIFECSKVIEAGFGGIVISILFGYICFILWAGNLWFLYKETSWFNGMQNSPSSNPGAGA